MVVGIPLGSGPLGGSPSTIFVEVDSGITSAETFGFDSTDVVPVYGEEPGISNLSILSNFYVANVTPDPRQVVCTSTIELPVGEIPGSQQVAYKRVVSAIRGPDTNQEAQLTPIGDPRHPGSFLKHPDGSWARARVHVPLRLRFGLGNAPSGYQRFREEIYQLDDGPVDPIPAYQEHPDIDLSDIRWTLRYKARDITVRTNPGPTPSAVRTATGTFMGADLVDFHAPYPSTYRDRVQQPDTAAAGTRTWVRAYHVAIRVVPEAQGGSETEPSMVLNLIYEVPSAASGCGRFIKFYAWVVNSLATTDADPRGPSSVYGELLQDIQIDVESISGGQNFQIVLDTTSFANPYPQVSPPSRLTNGYRIHQYRYQGMEPVLGITTRDWRNIQNSSDRKDSELPYGASIITRGYLVFTDGLTEASDRRSFETLSSMTFREGEFAFTEPVSDSHTPASGQVGQFGAFGVVYQPEDLGHSTRQDWWDLVNSYNQDAVNFFRTAAGDVYAIQWPNFSPYTGPTATNQSGGVSTFGAFPLIQFAGSRFSDFRAVFMCLRLDAQRPQHFVTLDGNVADWSELSPSLDGDSDAWDSRLFCYESQPWRLPLGQEQGGKGPGLALVGSDAGPKSPYRTTSWDGEHNECHLAWAYAILTGDRWCLDWHCVSLKEMNMAMHPVGVSYDSFSLNNGMNPVGWNDTGMFAGRIPRRWARTKKQLSHCYALLGGDDVAKILDAHCRRGLEWGTLGNPTGPGGSLEGPLLNNELAQLDYEEQLYGTNSDIYSCSNIGQNAFPITGANYRDTFWIGWQTGLMAEASYAMYSVLNRYSHRSTYTAGISAGLELATKFGAAVLKHGHLLNDDGVTFDSINGIDVQRGTAEEGSAVPENLQGESSRIFFCDRNGIRTQANQFGPQNPNRQGMPRYRCNRNGTYYIAVLHGMFIGALLNPNDSNCQRAVTMKLRNPSSGVLPTIAQIAAGSGRPVDGYFQYAAVIPRPFTRWADGTGITGTGIASGESFGTPTVDVTAQQILLQGFGIASEEVFGNPNTVDRIRLTSGIPSAEYVGFPRVRKPIQGVGGIRSEGRVGDPALNLASAVPTVPLPLGPFGGIPSEETFGATSVIYKHVIPSGIASEEAVGDSYVLRAFGIEKRIFPAGAIASAEAFGSPEVAYSSQITLSGIASAEAVGSHRVARSKSIITVGIQTTSAVGTPTQTPKVHIYIQAGIDSAEEIGIARIVIPKQIIAEPIASAEAFGTLDAEPLAFPAGDGLLSLPSVQGRGSVASSTAFNIIPDRETKVYVDISGVRYTVEKVTRWDGGRFNAIFQRIAQTTIGIFQTTPYDFIRVQELFNPDTDEDEAVVMGQISALASPRLPYENDRALDGSQVRSGATYILVPAKNINPQDTAAFYEVQLLE